MNWEDTVIKVREYPEGEFDPITSLLLEKQAGTSFNLGMKEVVEFVNGNLAFANTRYFNKWLAFLEEKGL